MGARVERGRALKYRACVQNWAGHFGGAVHSADQSDQPDQAEVVSCPAGRTLPSTRAGGQDDVSYTNSLKLITSSVIVYILIISSVIVYILCSGNNLMLL